MTKENRSIAFIKSEILVKELIIKSDSGMFTDQEKKDAKKRLNDLYNEYTILLYEKEKTK